MSNIINKKLHPYYKTGINRWIGEEVDDNDYILCPICGEVLDMNYCDYASEQGCNDKCPKCSQELDYNEIYDFEDICYFEQLLEIKDQQLAEKDKEIEKLKQTINTLHQNTRSASIEDSNLIHELENQIAEKDKEIEEYHKWLDRYSVVPYQIMLLIEGLKAEKNNIRHQVCDEIREKIEKRLNGITNANYSEAYKDGCYRIVGDVNDFLDQVEGENDGYKDD